MNVSIPYSGPDFDLNEVNCVLHKTDNSLPQNLCHQHYNIGQGSNLIQGNSTGIVIIPKNESNITQIPIYQLRNNCCFPELLDCSHLFNQSHPCNKINISQAADVPNLILNWNLKKYKEENFAALGIILNGSFVSNVFPITSNNVRGLKYICCQCNEMFITKNSLITHIKIHQRPFCFKCFMFFPDEISLKEHSKSSGNNSVLPENNVIDLTLDEEKKEEEVTSTFKHPENVDDAEKNSKNSKHDEEGKSNIRIIKTISRKSVHKITKTRIQNMKKPDKNNNSKFETSFSNENMTTDENLIPKVSRFGRKIYIPKKD